MLIRQTRYWTSWLLALAVVALATEAKAQSGDPPATSYRHIENERGVEGVVARAYFQAPIERLWQVLNDTRRSPEIFPQLERAVPIQGQTVYEYHFDFPLLDDQAVRVRINRDSAQRRISWERISGYFDEFSGYFQLTESQRYPGWVQVEYGSFLELQGVVDMALTDDRHQEESAQVLEAIRRALESA